MQRSATSFSTVLFLWNACYIQGALFLHGFTSSRSNPRYFLSKRYANTARFNRDVYSSLTTLYSTINEKETFMQRQIAAREALYQSLEKQRKEIQETEDLIKNLDLEMDFGGEVQNEMKHGNNTSSRKKTLGSTLTKSIYSGADYGFISRSEGCSSESLLENDGAFEGYGPPSNLFALGREQFMRNLNAMKGEYKEEKNVKLTKKQVKLQEDLKKLTLNSTAIWEREKARGEIVAPLIIKVPYYVLCYLLDVVFEGRYVFSRFFLLETVARMPYMGYITMLHLYETLGFWRRSADVKRVHFAEEWNEYHHLLVMESLGGDQAWFIRFMSQHSALVYFTVLTVLFAISPSLSYKFSEMLETHAVDTYGQFIDENEEALKELPPSLAALEYYTLGISDPMFGEYQTTAQVTGGKIRKPGMDMTSLYDVFKAIRADEGDHVGTMKACLDPEIPVLSPALETRFLTGFALAATVGYFLATGDLQDDLLLTDLADFTDLADGVADDAGIFGGVAALFGGMNAMQGEMETAADNLSEIEGLASGGDLSAVLITYFKQGIQLLLKILRFL